MNKDEALKMAIEALENIAFEYGQLLDGEQDYGLLPSETNEDIVIAYRVKRACEEALEQPTVAELNDEYLRDTNLIGLEQPAWQGLTDDEIDKIYYKTFDTWSSEVDIDFAHAIEAKLKEKNT